MNFCRHTALKFNLDTRMQIAIVNQWVQCIISLHEFNLQLADMHVHFLKAKKSYYGFLIIHMRYLIESEKQFVD